MRGPEIRPFAQIRFPEEHGTSCAQLRRDERILRRNGSLERQRPGGGSHPVSGVDIVLEQNRNSMQRPAHASRLSLAVERFRDRQSIRIDLEYVTKRRPLAIELLDPRDVLPRDRGGRHTPRCHPRLEIPERCFLEIKRRDRESRGSTRQFRTANQRLTRERFSGDCSHASDGTKAHEISTIHVAPRAV
jgi:hypothetical protein